MNNQSEIEITVYWQETLLRLEHLQDDQYVFLNGNDPLVTVPVEVLGEEAHILISIHNPVQMVHLLPSMRAILNGVKVKAPDYILKVSDELEIKMGPFRFVIKCVTAQKPIMSVFSKEAEWGFGKTVGGVSILQ